MNGPRRHRSAVVSSRRDDSKALFALGYIVSVNRNGLLIWSKIHGGSLVRVPCSTLPKCPPPPPPKKKDEFHSQFIAMKMRKIIPRDEDAPHFVSPLYECVVYRLLSDSMAHAYFPHFNGLALMSLILEPNMGAILTVTTPFVSPSRRTFPSPQLSVSIYCPPWSFLEAGPDGHFREYCALDQMYKCRIVFVRDRELAYDCQWIAIAVKRAYTSGESAHSSGRLPCPKNATGSEITRRLGVHKNRKDLIFGPRKWDPADCRRRAALRIRGIIESDKDTNFASNCDTLRRFLRSYSKHGSGSGRPRGALFDDNPSWKGDKLVKSSQTQTTITGSFFDEYKRWLVDVGDVIQPDDLQQFWARFSSLRKVFK